MSWNLRLQQMIMAGGVFSFSACGGHGTGLVPVLNADADSTPRDPSPGTIPSAPPIPIPCGNASSDPCICGAAGPGPDALDLCHACWMAHGQWRAEPPTGGERCVGGDEASTDASADVEAGADAGDVEVGVVTPGPIPIGNALSDPCVSERYGDGGPDAALVCDACWADGGVWQRATSTQAARCVGGRDAAASDADAPAASDGNASHG